MYRTANGRSLTLAALTALSGAFTPVHADDRIEALLRQMTRDEKLGLVHGAAEPAATNQGQAGYWPGVPRLRIPALRLTDGPQGILTRQASTGMTATMGLAATFSREDARANGVIIGEDARALGEDVVLEPYINIHRDQTWERAYNTFGEDPFLTGQIAAAEIKGIQQQGVMAQAKHFIAYESGADEVVVGEQALHEIYAAPFAAAIEAGVASIMCSYNRVNGEYSCGNPATLQRLLRDELHFEGFVTSDWGAVHDTLYINRGLDLEMPGYRLGDNFLAYLDAEPSRSPLTSAAQLVVDAAPDDALPEEPRTVQPPPPASLPPAAIGLRAALESGQVPESTIDASLRRILGQLERFGYLDRPPSHAVVPERSGEHAPILRRTAEDAAVLLKNEHGLPLEPADLESLALIGPGAGQLMAIGVSGEKALGHLDRQTSPLKLLGELGHVHFAVADDMTGEAVPLDALSDSDPHLRRTMAIASQRAATAVPATVLEHTVQRGTALPAGTSRRWSGDFSVPAEGDYDLNLELLGATGSLSVDGGRVAATDELGLHGGVLQPSEDNVLPTLDGLDNVRRRVHLSAGTHAFVLELHADSSGQPVQVRLAWVTPAERQTRYQEAIATAREAHTAIVFAWSRGRPEFALPGDQDALIREVAAVNPNTIVVLNASEPMAMPWLAKVRAVLLMWYPGDEGGAATVNLLLGRKSPGGRLPFTWPLRLEDNVANDPAHPERQSKRPGGSLKYSEGLFVGYRWFDQQHRAPLFPFGFGLSYTRFAYSGLTARRTPDDAVVRFKLTNRGRVAGDEVPQVYLGAPRDAAPGVEFAARALAGFDRVHLAAGASRVMEVHIPLRQLEYWSTGEHRWIDAPDRVVYVGGSSRDLRLRATL